eukprot:TRINITY_DN4536_c0_g1_i1.p1 TRINITY_DN4536_c0_g1~~TRINITY_DN4536_c0_g1_i1.p1  ORF type:complete len:131 (+),score=34.23 TRINITY_DN4536_c0_g1_i1:65-457(+)
MMNIASDIIVDHISCLRYKEAVEALTKANNLTEISAKTSEEYQQWKREMASVLKRLSPSSTALSAEFYSCLAVCFDILCDPALKLANLQKSIELIINADCDKEHTSSLLLDFTSTCSHHVFIPHLCICII